MTVYLSSGRSEQEAERAVPISLVLGCVDVDVATVVLAGLEALAVVVLDLVEEERRLE